MPQLSLHQRQILESLHRRKATKAAMARELGVHPATIKRELERNSHEGNYDALRAHEQTKTRKQKAGTENQKKRAFRYLSMKSLVQWQINFRTAMNERDPDTPVIGHTYIKRHEKRFRLYTFRPDVLRPKRKKTFRRWQYLEWKKWYDRRVRKRNHILETLRRTPRFAREIFRLRNSFPFKKNDIDDRRLIRFADRVLARMEKENALDRLKKIVRYSYPIPFTNNYFPFNWKLVLEQENKNESSYKKELEISITDHFF